MFEIVLGKCVLGKWVLKFFGLCKWGGILKFWLMLNGGRLNVFIVLFIFF